MICFGPGGKTFSWVDHARALALWLGICTAPVLAQNANPAGAPYLVLRGAITQSACNLAPVLDSLGDTLVVNLPALQTTFLLDTPFSPVAPLKLRFNLSDNSLGCLNALGGISNQIVFDAAFAAVAPRSGLLRNSATLRPAQNVLVQLGLIGADGVFTPLDLNQPQALNKAMNLQANAASANPGLNLGMRYVAARFVSEQYANVGSFNPGASDVTAGNVSVYLPFVLSLK